MEKILETLKLKSKQFIIILYIIKKNESIYTINFLSFSFILCSLSLILYFVAPLLSRFSHSVFIFMFCFLSELSIRIIIQFIFWRNKMDSLFLFLFVQLSEFMIYIMVWYKNDIVGRLLVRSLVVWNIGNILVWFFSFRPSSSCTTSTSIRHFKKAIVQDKKYLYSE